MGGRASYGNSKESHEKNGLVVNFELSILKVHDDTAQGSWRVRTSPDIFLVMSKLAISKDTHKCSFYRRCRLRTENAA